MMNEKIKDGLHTEWYENGQLYRQRNYKGGKEVEFIGIWNEDNPVRYD